MGLAPDAVQNDKSDSLTESYKRNFPLFHKLFLSAVENFGRPSGHRAIRWSKFKIEIQDRNSKPKQFVNSDEPITR
jgi:hypothetical protein